MPATGGSASLMLSNHEVAAMGASIALTLSQKDEAWSFDHNVTLTSCVPAPHADEILLYIG
ncbi:amino acid synthesis family protein [Marivita sp. XM-24bin2]|uniref:amino acid synthesis family protein n=2 Tax=unclassified Marivita TaxID=2632480 RepID=UPI003412B446